ncbi:MAG: quinone oxidoreductase [Rhodospirillaceae bacterium]|nr:quinone oxidoreductase [Rhodospirillaceae bacterium]
MTTSTSIEPPAPTAPAGAEPLDAVHTRERQFTRIFTTMYGQKHRARSRLPVKTQAVRMHAAGGPEVLQVEDLWVPDPGATEVRIAQRAAGLNFLDTYQRRGTFPSPGLPWVIGFEGAGVVEAVGGAVTTLKEGDRVAYASAPPGSYVGLRTIAADALVKLPDAVGFEQAAAVMLKGMTAEYLVHKSGAVQPGDTVLVHAAAGGTGLLLCQWLAHKGATVIGCAGGDEKRGLAEAHGCRHAIDYRREDVAARVAELSGSEGLAVVYDSVGRDTAEASVACLRPGGTLVLYGGSSGAPSQNALAAAAAKSIRVVRPGLFQENDTPVALQTRARALLEVLESGAVAPLIGRHYALADAADAHRDLEARRTTGQSVLIPE